jgi:protein-L-isoaspartate(D-aspartate) O-methyltransferase
MFGGDDPMDYDEAREQMVEDLERSGRIQRASTAGAMRAVPRHEFVPEGRRRRAYRDTPLPIGEGQTISAPHMVATMVDQLALSPGDDVLEIGTGCGYHAAVTAEVVGADHVYSVEYHEPLAAAARERFERLGYGAIGVRAGDGHEGWPEHAPYDAAYLTCAASTLPDAVVEQVRPGGRVLAPVGDRRQRLVLVHRREDGTLDRERLGGVRFVPMRGGD